MKFSLTQLVFLVCCVLTTFDAVRADGAENYRKIAFPIITIVGGTVLVIATYLMSVSSRKTTGTYAADQPVWRGNSFFWGCLVFIYLVGIFLTFGPDVAPGVASASSNPRSAIIGLQLLLSVALGIYLSFHPSPIITDIYIVFGVFNLLSLFGSNYLFNYNYAIWTLEENSCNAYFSGSDNTVNSFTRCNDDGYLQFLRIMGHLVSLVVLGSIVAAIASAYERGYALFHSTPATAAGAPVATGPSSYGTNTGYTSSNPAYATTGVKDPAVPTSSVPATSVPVNY